MKFKCTRSKKLIFGISAALTALLSVFMSSPSAAGPADDQLSLSVTIQSRHTSHFEVCVPVKVNEPFRIVWGNEKVKDSVSGVVRPADGGEYPVTLNISEGGGSCRSMIVPKLKLGEPDEWSTILSLAFNHIDKGKVILAKGGCQ